jgi:hypothetical protein
MERRTSESALLPELEFLGEHLVPGRVCNVEIVQEPPPLADHLQQTPPGTVVFDVFLEMFGQLIDPLREQSDLNIRGTSIPFVDSKFFNNFGLHFHNFRKCLP